MPNSAAAKFPILYHGEYWCGVHGLAGSTPASRLVKAGCLTLTDLVAEL